MGVPGFSGRDGVPVSKNTRYMTLLSQTIFEILSCKCAALIWEDIRVP